MSTVRRGRPRRRRSRPYRPDRPIFAEMAAGGVLVDGRGEKVLLLHEIEEDRWCFPKGHVEPGESLEETARREVEEETGLQVRGSLQELGSVSYRFFQPRRDRNVHKVVYYFRMRAPGGTPSLERIFDDHRWVSLATASRLLGFDADRAVLGWMRRARRPRRRRTRRVSAK